MPLKRSLHRAALAAFKSWRPYSHDPALFLFTAMCRRKAERRAGANELAPLKSPIVPPSDPPHPTLIRTLKNFCFWNPLTAPHSQTHHEEEVHGHVEAQRRRLFAHSDPAMQPHSPFSDKNPFERRLLFRASASCRTRECCYEARGIIPLLMHLASFVISGAG